MRPDLIDFIVKNIIHLLYFDEINVWIFFKSQLIHTFTESKGSNCFILYIEEIVVFWNKTLHVLCPDVVLHFVYITMLSSESLSFNILFNVPSDKVANLCFGHRRYVCIYRPHFVFWLTDAANELLFHLLIKIECS